jgi:hypothetical protein
VHEYQVWVAAFMEAVTPSHAPCGGVLRIGYKAVFDFCNFEFLGRGSIIIVFEGN